MGKLLKIEFSSLRQIKTDNVVLKIDMSDFQKGGRAPPTPPSKSATVTESSTNIFVQKTPGYRVGLRTFSKYRLRV